MRRATINSVIVLLALTAAGVLLPVAASAAATVVTLSGPASFAMHGNARFTARLSGVPEGAMAGRSLRLERQETQENQTWSAVATGTTDASGVAAVTARFERTGVYRAVFDGEGDLEPTTSAPVTVTGVRRPTRVQVTGTWSVVDGARRTLTARHLSNIGEPVAGSDLRVHTRLTGRTWRLTARVRTGTDGSARFVLAPRHDVRVQVNVPAGSWWEAASSKPRVLDNRPPVAPVAYPRRAPKPRYVAPQQRQTGTTPRAVVQRIPDDVWASMRGRSWHAGCPVGRSELRLIRVNYWDFTGYQRRGEMVVRDDIAARAAAALSDMYRARLPIRRMYRVDRFGWSAWLQGGNDLASMAADNTSAFNCRSVTNWPGRRSPHSYGRAIDINPFENPYVSRTGVVPNRWWLHRSHPRIAWRSAAHPVVRIWRSHGFRWSYPGSDPQHWDGRSTRGAPAGGTFVAD